MFSLQAVDTQSSPPFLPSLIGWQEFQSWLSWLHTFMMLSLQLNFFESTYTLNKNHKFLLSSRIKKIHLSPHSPWTLGRYCILLSAVVFIGNPGTQPGSFCSLYNRNAFRVMSSRTPTLVSLRPFQVSIFKAHQSSRCQERLSNPKRAYLSW